MVRSCAVFPVRGYDLGGMMQQITVTDDMRRAAILAAVQRELDVSDLRRDDGWPEMQDKTVAELVAANTDALIDDWYEARPVGADANALITMVAAGADLLGVPGYLAMIIDCC